MPKKSTDELDELGTSEESASGDIIIYRDRDGKIEGTSETHGVKAGPDGEGDFRGGGRPKLPKKGPGR